MNRPDPIPSDRLMDAADAIFLALEEIGAHAFPEHPSELMGREDQPRAFCEFTRPEILAAQDFLQRAGLLPETR